jgi:SAM-dependent methyltransferase
MLSNIKQLVKQFPGYNFLKIIYYYLIDIGTTNEHWARVVMNRETRKLIKGLQPETLKVLEISGDRWERIESFKSYKTVSFPDYDSCESTLGETFDLIIAEQVFEHLLWPYRAVKNIYKMLNPKGYFLITTPFLIRIHNFPIDCSRWTETGMKYFLAESGFDLESIRTGSWGNRACIKANFRRFRRYHPIFHSLENEPDFPVAVWALVQK